MRPPIMTIRLSRVIAAGFSLWAGIGVTLLAASDDDYLEQLRTQSAALKTQAAEACKDPQSSHKLSDVFDERGEIAAWFAEAVSRWPVPAGTDRAQVMKPAVDCVNAEWRYRKAALTVKLRETPRSPTPDQKAALDAAWERYLTLSSVRASLDLLTTDGDIYDLKVRAYAATVFSNLFQEATPDTPTNNSFFDSPKPYFLFELSQTVTGDRSLDTFASFAFAGVAAQNGPTADDIAKANSVAGDVRIAFWPNILPARWAGPTNWGQIGVGLGVTGGFVGVPTRNDKTPTSLQGLFRAGFLTRELAGHWEGSFTEIAYARDPRFNNRNRFYARGRLVLSSLNPELKGHGIGGFIEGSINTRFSTSDPDEARLTIGAVLPLDSILGAIFPSSEKPNSENGGAGKPDSEKPISTKPSS